MGDRNRGVYHKFNVVRTDGKSDPGQKHHNCFYFVLDCDHDPHAKAALEAYARSCKHEYPTLASDVQAIVQGCAFGSGEDKHVSDVLTIPPYSSKETRPECPSCFGDKTITMSDGSKRPCELCAPLVKVPPVETRACPSCGYQTPILDGVCNVCAERPAPL
jgi:hypothetical protein